MNVVINTGTTANLNQTTSNNHANQSHYSFDERVSVSRNDIACSADEFNLASTNFCLLSEAVELLKKHRDDKSDFNTLCEIIQQACYNMANNAEHNKKDLQELLASADSQQSA
ncbi:hypothetical protein MBO_05119 [Moraxella bovoculi 237]|uniref:Uncharacterized protein n=1 Tax=Moraxella bovoculi 237 TaxID=743974 RepID=A0A066ULX0_9GAMM|nr:hypothetical protein [Moraxella bovoculi]KDN25163.1 hypothetical protein MBO_05119 [Moraxella bovoculi 237]